MPVVTQNLQSDSALQLLNGLVDIYLLESRHKPIQVDSDHHPKRRFMCPSPYTSYGQAVDRVKVFIGHGGPSM